LIRYLLHNEIDKDKWDACIQRSFNGNMYARSWYLDIVHKNWEALVEGDYVRVMPLTGNRKWGIHYLYQPFFAQQLGIFSTTILTDEVICRFLEAIPQKYRFVQINLNIHNQAAGKNYRWIANQDYLLDLIGRYARLAAAYSSNTKRNLKKARASGLTLSKGMRPQVLIDLFRAHKGSEIAHWHDNEYRRLQQLMYMASYKHSGMLYGVYTPHNELCAGAFFLKDQKYLVFLFSALNSEARENGAMTFLIDAVIREFSESVLVLDFEGSNQPGLARFYKGFGAQQVTYYSLEINRLSFPVKQVIGLLKARRR
jgi:hypothetical protein